MASFHQITRTDRTHGHAAPHATLPLRASCHTMLHGYGVLGCAEECTSTLHEHARRLATAQFSSPVHGRACQARAAGMLTGTAAAPSTADSRVSGSWCLFPDSATMTDPALQRLARLQSHLLAPAAYGAEAATFGSHPTSSADVQNELQTLLEHDSWQASSVTRPPLLPQAGCCRGVFVAISTACRCGCRRRQARNSTWPRRLPPLPPAPTAAATMLPWLPPALAQRALPPNPCPLPSHPAGARHHEGADAVGAVCAALCHPTGGGAGAGAAPPPGAAPLQRLCVGSCRAAYTIAALPQRFWLLC